MDAKLKRLFDGYEVRNCQEQDDSRPDAQVNPRHEEGASRASILKDKHSRISSLMVCMRLGSFGRLAECGEDKGHRSTSSPLFSAESGVCPERSEGAAIQLGAKLASGCLHSSQVR